MLRTRFWDYFDQHSVEIDHNSIKFTYNNAYAYLVQIQYLLSSVPWKVFSEVYNQSR